MTKLGAYDAERASALSGVPQSTLYEWARRSVLVPSISEERIKYWSWSDLVAARAVYWLRHPRSAARPATSMPKIRELIAHIESEVGAFAAGIADKGVRLFVDSTGTPHVEIDGVVTEGRHAFQQGEHPQFVEDLLAEFSGDNNTMGPDLRVPSQYVRINPAVLSGEPHIEATRIETRVIHVLRQRGYEVADLVDMYPGLRPEVIRSALRLEKRLANNARLLKAA